MIWFIRWWYNLWRQFWYNVIHLTSCWKFVCVCNRLAMGPRGAFSSPGPPPLLGVTSVRPVFHYDHQTIASVRQPLQGIVGANALDREVLRHTDHILDLFCRLSCCGKLWTLWNGQSVFLQASTGHVGSLPSSNVPGKVPGRPLLFLGERSGGLS